MRIARNWQQISASLLVAIGFFVTGWVTGARASGSSEDGPGWRNVPTECRLLYVIGFDSAYRIGSFQGEMKFQDRLEAAVLKNQITRELKKELTAKEEKPSPQDPVTVKLSWTGWTATKVTGEQIKEGMDRFYANPANQAICWQDAFIVVAQSIARLRFSEADMNELRRVSAKQGCG